MRISIVLATYQGERYIKEQLLSLQNQTQSVDEVLIFDDGSIDNTIFIIRDFINDHNLFHWRLHLNEERLGFKENFKQGLRKSTGDVVFLCDQDDRWKEDKIEKLIAFFARPDVLSIASGFAVINENGSIVGDLCQNLLGTTMRDKELLAIPLSFLLKNNYAQGCTMAVRSQLIDKYMHDDLGCLEHDWSLSLLSSMMDGCYFYNEALVEYRIHGNNVIGLSTEDTAVVRKERTTERLSAIEEEEKRIDFVRQFPELLADQKEVLDHMKEYYTFRRHCLQNRKIVSLAVTSILGKYRKDAVFTATLGDMAYLLKHKRS